LELDIDASLWASLQNATVNNTATVFPGGTGQKLLLPGSGDRIATSVGLTPVAGAILQFDLIIGNGNANIES